MNRFQWFNALSFQVGWFCCVIGGNAVAVPVGIVLLTLHFLYVSRDRREWEAVIIGATLGMLCDSALHAVGIFNFNDMSIGVPLWLVAVWLLFMTTLAHSLCWLQTRMWLAALLGAVAGPGSYWAGVQMGAAAFGIAAPWALVSLAAVWALLLPLLLALMKYRMTRL